MATKMQEFMANSPEVLCARFTSKAPSLLATGGSDNKVGVWRSRGAYACLASLSGPTAPVTAVTLSPSQNASEAENVVGGDESGVLRVWNLARQQETRKYSTSCHKAAVTYLDYHPFGEFFVSSSYDGNVKVWDLRKKACLQTYKYQEGKEAGRPEVSYVRFSPDGRMVASGNEDGTVILWDLLKGKKLHRIRWHNSRVTSIDFHPQEFILSVGCADGVISYWNIDDWTLLSQTPSRPGRGGVRAMGFSSDGSALLSCHEQGLDVWGWGDVPHHDSVVQNWGSVGAMACYQNTQEAYCASFVNSFVSIYSVNLGALAPFKSSSSAAPKATAAAAQKAPTPTAVQQPDPSAQHHAGYHGGSAQQQQVHAPPQQPQAGGFAPHGSAGSGAAMDLAKEPSFGRRGTTPPADMMGGRARYHNESERARPRGRSGGHDQLGSAGHAHSNPSSPGVGAGRRARDFAPLPGQGLPGGSGGGAQTPQHFADATPAPAPSTAAAAAAAQLAKPAAAPAPAAVAQRVDPVPMPTSELDAASLAHREGFHSLQILGHRLLHVRVLKSLYATDPRDAVQHLYDVARDDPGIAADFLSTLGQTKMKKTLNLDVCCALMPLVGDLLAECFENYVYIAIRAARTILGLMGPPMGRVLRQGVDGDTRVEKYQGLSSAFRSLEDKLRRAKDHSKLAGGEAGQLLAEIAAI